MELLCSNIGYEFTDFQTSIIYSLFDNTEEQKPQEEVVFFTLLCKILIE